MSPRRVPAAGKVAGAVADDPLVVFTPSGRRGNFRKGTPLLQAARELGVDLDSVCGGRGICTRCQVTIGEGDFAKHGIASSNDHLTPFTEPENRQQEKGLLKPGRRLSCQSRIGGDLVVDVPPESQVHKQVVRKRAEARSIELHPAVHLHYVEVTPPDMHEPAAHLRRLKQALHEQWDLEAESADIPLLQEAQQDS